MRVKVRAFYIEVNRLDNLRQRMEHFRVQGKGGKTRFGDEAVKALRLIQGYLEAAGRTYEAGGQSDL